MPVNAPLPGEQSSVAASWPRLECGALGLGEGVPEILSSSVRCALLSPRAASCPLTPTGPFLGLGQGEYSEVGGAEAVELQGGVGTLEFCLFLARDATWPVAGLPFFQGSRVQELRLGKQTPGNQGLRLSRQLVIRGRT